MYTALYRAERPEIFDEILGQEHIVKILRHQVASDTVSHAYLFCGTRGTGKTTTARVLAKAVNCLGEGDRPCGHCANCVAIKNGSFMDVIEIDAASNNGVDNIRELRESVNYPPAVGRKKVYIIDEVHMLSTGASNALLKTLEEPPENVIFILATTDPQKLPQTILSRCMRLDFKRVPEHILADHMKRICDEKGVEITDSALRLLASNADGSVRDGLSILDQCLSGGDRKLDRDIILDFLGAVSEEFFIELTEKVLLHNVAEALILLDGALRDGKDVKQLMKDWMEHYRSLLITKYIRNAEDMLNMSSDNIEKLRDQSNQISLDEINDGILTLSKTINDAKYSTQPRILMELAIVTIATGLTQGTAVVKQAAAAPVKPKTVKPVKTVKVQNQEGKVEETDTLTPEHTEHETDIKTEDKMADTDLEELWNDVFEAGEGNLGSLNLLRNNTTLAALGNEEFKVIANNEFTRNYMEDHRTLICQLMEKITGRNMKLVCKLAGQEKQDEDMTAGAERLAGKVDRVLEMEIKTKVK